MSLRLHYDEDNFENVYVNYVFSIHKYSNYKKYRYKGKNIDLINKY